MKTKRRFSQNREATRQETEFVLDEGGDGHPLLRQLRVLDSCLSKKVTMAGICQIVKVNADVT